MSIATAQAPATIERDSIELFSPAQLAERLGVNTRTVRRLVLAGRVPEPLKIGRAVRWPRKAIERWIDAGCPRRD